MNITKARALKMQKELENHQIKNHDHLNRMRTYYRSAKGGKASDLLPTLKALKAVHEDLAKVSNELDKVIDKRKWA